MQNDNTAILVELDLVPCTAVTAEEVDLVEALLPELLKDMLWLQPDPDA